MSLKTHLIQRGSGRSLHTTDGGISVTSPIMVTHTEASITGVWKSVNRSTAGTTVITEAPAGGSVVITDVLVSTTKTNATTVVICFTDGVETEFLFRLDTSSNPHAFGVPISGKFQGWRNAKIEMITSGNVDATITLGYYKTVSGLSFSEWDSLR